MASRDSGLYWVPEKSHRKPLPTQRLEFPPGQDHPGFVPLGTAGVASKAQGNFAGISIKMRRRLIHAEREMQPPLKYSDIHAKYANWNCGLRTIQVEGVRGSSAHARNRIFRQNLNEFVPLGVNGVANEAQCNLEGISTTDRRRLIETERDMQPPLTYRQLHHKYFNWGAGFRAISQIDIGKSPTKRIVDGEAVWTVLAVKPNLKCS